MKSNFRIIIVASTYFLFSASVHAECKGTQLKLSKSSFEAQTLVIKNKSVFPELKIGSEEFQFNPMFYCWMKVTSTGLACEGSVLKDRSGIVEIDGGTLYVFSTGPGKAKNMNQPYFKISYDREGISPSNGQSTDLVARFKSTLKVEAIDNGQVIGTAYLDKSLNEKNAHSIGSEVIDIRGQSVVISECSPLKIDKLAPISSGGPVERGAR